MYFVLFLNWRYYWCIQLVKRKKKKIKARVRTLKWNSTQKSLLYFHISSTQLWGKKKQIKKKLWEQYVTEGKAEKKQRKHWTLFVPPKQKTFFQTLPKTVHKEQFFKWKHQSYLIHELGSATENTLRSNGELSKGTNHPEQQNWLQDMEKTPAGRSVK